MRFRTAALAVALVLNSAAGCTSVRLGQRTIRQASTLPDLQYQQVLDNLALFSTNPSALPWHVNLREGTTQVTDSATAGGRSGLGPPPGAQPPPLPAGAGGGQGAGPGSQRPPPSARRAPRSC